MTIDFWGLGLQAFNVVILVWLLSRVFWRPIADAIAKRNASPARLVAPLVSRHFDFLDTLFSTDALPLPSKVYPTHASTPPHTRT